MRKWYILLIAYAQTSTLNVHAYIYSGTRDQILRLSMYLLINIVHAISEALASLRKFADSPEPSLLAMRGKPSRALMFMLK